MDWRGDTSDLNANSTENTDRDSPITSSILNFLSRGAPFHPSEAVCAHVQEILIMQEQLREPFNRMYTAGWLDRLGADVLTPLEFNLISEMERLVNDPSIFNFLISYRKPRTALTRINPFLGYYLSVTRSTRFKLKLHDAVRKSLRKIVFIDSREADRIDRIMATLENFLSDTTLNRFIIPLFECAYLRPLSGDEIMEFLSLDDLDETACRADARLVEIMDERKKRYNEVLKRTIFSLEDELDFVLELKDIVESVQNLPNERSVDFLDHLLYYYYSGAGKSESRASSVPVMAGDLCDIFTLTYQTALFDGVTVKTGRDLKSIQLFEKSLFEKEIEIIRNERRVLNNYERKPYTRHLLNLESPDGEEQFFITSLVRIVDAFYSTGVKLHSIIKGHEDSTLKEEKTNESRISEKTMGKTRIPYSGHVIAGSHIHGAFQFTMSNRRVMEVLEDTKKFCFSFAHRFEYRHRDFTGNARKESIADKIRKLDEIIEKIKNLESGRTPGA